MKKSIMTGVAAFALLAAGQGQAADVGRAPGAAGYKDTPWAGIDWTGFYAGGHVGGAWNDIDVFDSFLARNASFHTDGVIGGGQLGYNFQSDRIVLGIEADFGSLDVSGSRPVATQVFPALGPSRWSASGGFYGDIAGRLGFAMDRALLYAKGGTAFLNLDTKAHVCTDACSDTGGSGTRWGWTLGGGAEYMLAPGWSVKAEYQHFDFGDETFTLNNFKGVFLGTDKFSVKSGAVTAGVNYHFGSVYQPLK